jgi:membrane-bound metal-dependent hydrolase YbcI (DUF457 family)
MAYSVPVPAPGNNLSYLVPYLSFPALVPVPEAIISNPVPEMAFPVLVPAPENNLSYLVPDLSFPALVPVPKKKF